MKIVLYSLFPCLKVTNINSVFSISFYEQKKEPKLSIPKDRKCVLLEIEYKKCLALFCESGMDFKGTKSSKFIINLLVLKNFCPYYENKNMLLVLVTFKKRKKEIQYNFHAFLTLEPEKKLFCNF